MFSHETKSGSYFQKWPIVVIVIFLLLLAVQMLRVNRPKTPTKTESTVTYTQPGPLIVGDITIPAGSFHSRKVDLNRRARLVGTFQTGSVQRRVSVLVLREREFELWNSNSVFTPVSETGYVPGGKVSPMLEPGGYYVVIDNRFNGEDMSVNVSFNVE